MSYDIRVINKKTGETVRFRNKHQIAGGTYAIGGTAEATFNITYNYAPFFYELWPKKGEVKKEETTPFGQMFAKNDAGIRFLYGKPIKEVARLLSEAIEKLPNESPDDDYWKATPGNARLALFKLKLLVDMATFEYPGEDLTLKGD